MNGKASLDTSRSPNTAPITSRDRGPTTGNVAQWSVTEVSADLQLRPLGLQPLLHPVEDLRRPAGGGVDEEAVLGQPQHGAVVDHHSVDAAHHAVPDRADLQTAHEVGVDPVQQLGGVAALHVDLAECGAIENADTACASPRIRATPRRPYFPGRPRRPEGSDADASTARRPRTPRPARRASRAAPWCAPGRTARHDRAPPARRTRPGCRAAEMSWCPTLRWVGRAVRR